MILVEDRSRLQLTGQESERLRFRKVTNDDFDTWMRFCEDPDSLRYIRPGNTDSAYDKCTAWFARVMNRYENLLGGMNALIEKSTGELVGQCGLLIQTVDGVEELEIGYSMMPAFRKQGYASEAAVKCKEYAFAHNFSDSLISIIHVENISSQNVALKNGMLLEKKTVFNDTPVNIYRIFSPKKSST